MIENQFKGTTMNGASRKRKTNSRNLVLESLENRQLFAVGVSIDSGVLNIDGDKYDNTATVSKLSSGAYKVVHKTNTGSEITKTFSVSDSQKVKSINFNGYQGNDKFENKTSLPSTARGDAGNDTLIGGSGKDVFHGNSGNDVLIGNSGDDLLYGDADHDQLFGGNGKDYLYGGSGNDSLFGGDTNAVDYLYGNSGADRFLLQGTDSLKDVSSEDVKIVFKNGSSAWNEAEIKVVDQAFAELQAATGNTKILKDTVNSFDLVFQKESSGFKYAGLNSTNTVTERYWDPWRFTWKTRQLYTERLIQIRDFDENSNSRSEGAMDTVIHEISHNWDSGSERSARGLAASAWDNFMAISGWRTTSASTHYRSGDGEWYYSKNSSGGFFGDVVKTDRGNSLTYGKWNPREDFATSMEAYFNLRRSGGPFATTGGFAGAARNSYAQAKLDAVGQFIRAIG